jgi:hypothetical protein
MISTGAKAKTNGQQLPNTNCMIMCDKPWELLNQFNYCKFVKNMGKLKISIETGV